ncbi:unnamed protein product [Nesidiocoris tenuis]|uniref:Uncharacterized protein n=1 Tax=Nesidiocoris tenuis TaxID=355587 RepID=A0A6H5GEA4_9HEMI|nr:unnamed protein product [Nesidiocoris tenuis]
MSFARDQYGQLLMLLLCIFAGMIPASLHRDAPTTAYWSPRHAPPTPPRRPTPAQSRTPTPKSSPTPTLFTPPPIPPLTLPHHHHLHHQHHNHHHHHHHSLAPSAIPFSLWKRLFRESYRKASIGVDRAHLGKQPVRTEPGRQFVRSCEHDFEEIRLLVFEHVFACTLYSADLVPYCFSEQSGRVLPVTSSSERTHFSCSPVEHLFYSKYVRLLIHQLHYLKCYILWSIDKLLNVDNELA